MRARLAYLHVPKVAGSSVVAAMRAAVPEGTRWCPYSLDTTVFGGFDRFDELAPEQRDAVHTGEPAALRDWDVVAGHFSLPGLLEAFDAVDVAVLLREPRARVLSHYTFWRGWSEAQHHEWTPYEHSRFAVGLDWGAFLTEPRLASQIDNLTLRLLVGSRPEVPPDGFIAEADLPALVASAIDRIDRLGHVDLIERGDLCWASLAAWADLELQVGRHNESRPSAGIDGSRAITPAAVRSLAERTAGDRAVWDHVAARLGVDDQAALADATWERHLMRVAGDETAALRAELQRWEGSTTARVTRPLRALNGRARAAIARRRG